MTTTRVFKAKYDGACSVCAEVITAGDLLEYDADDRVVHSDCTPHDTGIRTRPACPRCFEIPATSGACGCDPDDQETRP